jgi:hypothetical protein
MEPATKIIRAGSSTLVAAKLQSFCLLSTRENSCCPLREFPSWIEISVENRPVFMKTGKTGDRFHRFIENRLVKFENFKNLK